MNRVAREAIIRTLVYASVFEAGLCVSDLKRLLLSKQLVSSKDFQHELKQLLRHKVVLGSNGWISLPGISRSYFKTSKISLIKVELARKRLAKIVWLPTLRGVAITGSVAISNAEEEEDIDLMLIARSGFLWTTRLLVNLILLVDGSLRTKAMRKVANKVCLNLWIDDSSLGFSKQTLYVARELAQCKWIYDEGGVQSLVQRDNVWAKSFVPGYSVSKINSMGRGSDLSSKLDALFWTVSGIICKPLEVIAFVLQLIRMKRTRERINYHHAFFHPRDTEGAVMKKYKKGCLKYKVDPLIL